MNDCWREQWIFGTKQINFFKKDVFFKYHPSEPI